MSIDTPSGTINQITPIREFVELTELETTQYMLGIENMSTGNGSKITFGNIINSLISGNDDNRLVKGNDDKLFVSLPIEIGNLTNLTTSNKNNLVSSINELNANMGDLSALETTATSSLVAAINSVAELTQPELLIDKVNQSKALITGNVAGYLEELEQLKMMKRTTFDRSKFAVVGSPTITSDGIASGFSSANSVGFSVTTGNIFTFKERITTSSSVSSTQIFAYVYRKTDTTDRLFDLRISDGQFAIVYKNSSGTNTVQLNLKAASVNTAYNVRIEVNNGSLSYYIDDTQIYTTDTLYVDGISKIETAPNGSFATFTGSIDFKQFSITVGGVEIFNGNKTGIDTIKSNDYTVVGTPTISADGIASGFSSGNYISLSTNINITDTNFEIDIPFIKTANNTVIVSTTISNSGNQSFALIHTDRLVLFLGTGAGWGIANTVTGTTNCSNNVKYIAKLIRTSTQYIIKLLNTVTGVETTEITVSSTTDLGNISTLYLGTSSYWSLIAYNTIYDLNAFKTYVNDNLVYQPCLKIPYTETSVQYGSKIVDAIYRDRVLDTYQQGYKDYKYYTLDEVNGNFTLPHGELYGILEQIRTENEQNNEAVRQIVDVKDNLYKILEGHQSTNKTLWDLITFTDNTEADNLLIGGDSPFTSNSSNSNFHFYLLNSIIGTDQPTDTAKLAVYKLFNKSHYDAQSDPIYVADGTIVIACANPTKLSKILLRSYDTYYTTPSIIHIHGANITNNMSRDITMTDFTSYAKYIGGISTTKEDTYTTPMNTNWGINRPVELTIDDKDTFNTFFISMSHWCSGQSGWNRRLVGVQVYGTQMANDDSNYTVKMSGDYENCKWIASNGKIYNTDDLYQQYGYIPKEKVELSRWISCFGSGIGQANATTRAADQYYPKYISGTISTTKNNGGQPWYFLRQTNYSAEPRPQVGYNVVGVGYLDISSTLNNQTVIDYTADSSFPIGEYYWEGTFGYNQSPTAHDGNTHMCGWCQLQKVYDDDSVEIIQTFSKEGSMYEPSVCYRTPRFYANRAFKKLRLIIKEMAFPNAAMVVSQMQLYYRDTAGNIARSFIPNATQYDLSYNTVKHKSNVHFFITPTGVRVGSNCFIEKTDPTVKTACVGNRWINENTKKSYVCNTSGTWTEEDFCEIGCMTMFGSKHKGMRLRTVANSENPMQKYIQDHGDMGGNLALDYSLAVNASTVITSSPTDPDFYFQAESKDENEGVEFSLPANTKTLQSYRRSLVKSKIYQGGQQFAHWSNCDHTGAVLKAYKTFDTSAAGEYIEGSEEEEQ